MLLATVAEHETINQRKVAHFVGVSPPAIKRQVDIALGADWLRIVTPNKSSSQILCLTPKGKTVAREGLHVLEKHLFEIFSDSGRQTDLMMHINVLLGHTKGVVDKQTMLMQDVKSKP
jgi:DNA-binding MarR family transcriptional regulator